MKRKIIRQKEKKYLLRLSWKFFFVLQFGWPKLFTSDGQESVEEILKGFGVFAPHVTY